MTFDTEISDAVEMGKRFRRALEDDTDLPCLHEELERRRPPNKKGDPHMLVCPCPKCSPRV